MILSRKNDASELLQKSHYDLAIIDIMLADESGIDLLREIMKFVLGTQVDMARLLMYNVGERGGCDDRSTW